MESQTDLQMLCYLLEVTYIFRDTASVRESGWLSWLSVPLSLLAEVMISGLWDQTPQRAQCKAGLSLPLCSSLDRVHMLSLTFFLSQTNNILKK